MITIYHSSGGEQLDAPYICDEIARLYRLKDYDYISNDVLWETILFNNNAYMLCGPAVDQAIKRAMRD